MRKLILALTFVCVASVAAETKTLRDPTMPPGSSKQTTSLGELKIDAIFINKTAGGNKKPDSAIIRGKTFVVGDKIAGATIIAIKPGQIQLKDDRGNFTILMPDANVKTPTTKEKKTT